MVSDSLWHATASGYRSKQERVSVSKGRQMLGKRLQLLSSPKRGKAFPIAWQPTVREQEDNIRLNR